MTSDMRFDNFNDDDDDDDQELEERLAQDPLLGQNRVFNLQALIDAWQDESPDNLYYLDTESGALILVNPNLFHLKELTDEVEKHKYRYLYLPKPATNQVKDDLRDFQKTIEDQKLRSLLDMAFESPHLISSFNKILASEQLTGALKEFREGRVRLRIRQWLEANSLADRWEI